MWTSKHQNAGLQDFPTAANTVHLTTWERFVCGSSQPDDLGLDSCDVALGFAAVQENQASKSQAASKPSGLLLNLKGGSCFHVPSSFQQGLQSQLVDCC